MSYYEITGINMRDFVAGVYNRSEPVGMGFLHYTEGPLSDEEADKLAEVRVGGDVRLHLDYVKGRCCKMVVWQRQDRLFIRDKWMDHTNYQLMDLLQDCGVSSSPIEELPESQR